DGWIGGRDGGQCGARSDAEKFTEGRLRENSGCDGGAIASAPRWRCVLPNVAAPLRGNRVQQPVLIDAAPRRLATAAEWQHAKESSSCGGGAAFFSWSSGVRSRRDAPGAKGKLPSARVKASPSRGIRRPRWTRPRNLRPTR